MIESATGLVLRTRPFTETSLIVHWLTPQHGRLDTIAKGARRPKSPLRGKLDLFYETEFSFSRSRRSQLHTLCEVELIETHAALRKDLDLLREAGYAAALIEQNTETDTPLPALFELLRGFLNLLPQRPPQPQVRFAFEARLLVELGQFPDLGKTSLTPGSRKVLETLAVADWPTVTRLKLSEAQTRELRQFLHGFLIYHLGRVPPAPRKTQ